MCGIAGIVDLGAGWGPRRLREIALSMRDSMVQRGPDDAGVWVDPAGSCALAHRRLAIIDLDPCARQPMGNEDGSVQVAFNGEIYNYKDLRATLESAGHRFVTRSDTEVLPHLFEELDTSNFEKLSGMFAFGIWHMRRRTLLLGRDPFGKKPLYYAEGPGWFAFASELSALTAVPGFERTVDSDAVAEYLLLQYVHAPRTIYRQARKLLPGEYLLLDLNSPSRSPRTGRHFSFDAVEPPVDRQHSADEEEVLHKLLVGAVKQRLMSDVPLGAFLSGGVDSSLIVAMMARECGARVKTFTIGFEGAAHSEHVQARLVAGRLGTEHYEQLLKPDVLKLLPMIAESLDEPLGDSSCLPTLLLARFTRRHVTVALSGDGGDEMFGGYNRYAETIEHSSAKPSEFYLSNRWLVFTPPEVARLMARGAPAVFEMLESWRKGLDSSEKPVLHRMRNLDVHSYMPGAVLAKVDRMSMQIALEVRCPLLDRSVARFAANLSAESCGKPGEGKRILRRLLARYIPAEWVNLPKKGFGIPDDCWSSDKLIGLARDILLPTDARLNSFVDRKALHSVIDRQSKGAFSMYELWNLLVLELWLRYHTA